MKKSTIIITAFHLISIASMLLPNPASAQGCVALRSMGMVGNMNLNQPNLSKGQWQFNTNYRYFKSFRHFKGDVEQKERLVKHTEVINYSHSFDFTFAYGLSNRWTLNFTTPIVYNERSSLYEHGFKERHSTYSFGLGDLRISANYWVWDPAKHGDGNLALGIGLKLPTGDYNYQDYFYNVGPSGTKALRPVDQSIQPGDGGLGLTLEASGFQKINRWLYGYGTLFYLVNPRNVNGTRTFRETLNPLLANEAYMSVPDQYLARVGVSFTIPPLHGTSFSLGGRIEGIPVRDLVGRSDGFRRPGYIVSLEPGGNYNLHHGNLYLNVPVALYRNRTQSLTDKERTAQTGVYSQGDAAFADYLINLGYVIRF